MWLLTGHSFHPNQFALFQTIIEVSNVLRSYTQTTAVYINTATVLYLPDVAEAL